VTAPHGFLGFALTIKTMFFFASSYYILPKKANMKFLKRILEQKKKPSAKGLAKAKGS